MKAVIPILLMLAIHAPAADSVSAAPDAMLTAEHMTTYLQKRPERDVIRWKDPARNAPLNVRILLADEKGLTVEKTLPAGLVQRTIPLRELAGVSYHLTDNERLLLRKPCAAATPSLRVLWETRCITLGMEGSNASVIGLAYARSLRLDGSSEALNEAEAILKRIRSKDASDANKSQLRFEIETLGLTRALRSGQPDEIDKLAWQITESGDNPDAMLLATAWLADRHFADLKTIEEENPRWLDDDEVRPLRQRLYHLSLDFALYPSLFHGTRATESSVGLKRTWEIHQHTGNHILAKQALEDLAALYPESSAAKETAGQLARLRTLEAQGKPRKETAEQDQQEPAANDGEKSAIAEPPPPPKRYNLFDE